MVLVAEVVQLELLDRLVLKETWEQLVLRVLQAMLVQLALQVQQGLQVQLDQAVQLDLQVRRVTL
jgi:hypothetical protein